MKYKYKKQFATGALALSLLVGGSSVFAASPQDLGIKIKNVQPTHQKQNKNQKTKKVGNNNTVGTVGSINSTENSTGFTVEVKNLKTKIVSSIDIQTNTGTVYSKNGKSALASDLSIGQKVIVAGTLDKTTNILTAKTVKIVIQVTNNIKSIQKNVGAHE